VSASYQYRRFKSITGPAETPVFGERPNLVWSNPMPWKVTAELISLSPFVLLWAAFTAAEAARVVADIRRGQQ
jgi:hypothetical protein